jgi:HNH endonuclease
MPTGIYNRKSGTTGSPSFLKNCEICGKEFRVYESKKLRACSKACGYELRKRDNLETRKCAYCGAEYKKTRHKPQIYCSPSCRNRATNEKRRGSEWKVRKSDGYVVRSDGHSQTEMQHRFVMEQVLGRKLKPFENVHHKNGDRADNRPGNLELWVRRQPYGQRLEDLLEWARALLESQGFTVVAPNDRHESLSPSSSPSAGQSEETALKSN